MKTLRIRVYVPEYYTVWHTHIKHDCMLNSESYGIYNMCLGPFGTRGREKISVHILSAVSGYYLTPLKPPRLLF